jgi:L-seryl-tRNA(Ser) seleniumtransferase
MTHRRNFLHLLSSLPWLSSLLANERIAAANTGRDYLKELGVQPIINAAGMETSLTGTLMLPEVLQAIEAMSHQYVRLNELHDAVGKRIAALLGCEAAMVTSGAAAALTVGTAACLTGTNPDFIRRLPDLTGLLGMKSEVIIQKSHRFSYDHAVRNCGVRLIEVETAEELRRAAGERTAMMLFLNKRDPQGRIKREEFVALGGQFNVPTFLDAAADLPPVGNLTKYLKMGFDLVTFSGGKGLRGPQSTGLLLGRKDLIAAARLHGPPNGDAIGRPMKVNKEEMVGLLVALELYLKRDHRKDWAEWERSIQTIADALKPIRGVTTERVIPPIANEVPNLRVHWDRKQIKLGAADLTRRPREGQPSIELVPGVEEPETAQISSWTLQAGEAAIIARRLREVFAA